MVGDGRARRDLISHGANRMRVRKVPTAARCTRCLRSRVRCRSACLGYRTLWPNAVLLRRVHWGRGKEARVAEPTARESERSYDTRAVPPMPQAREPQVNGA